MSDPQDLAEQLDDDAEPMTAPDRPLGAQAYGAAGTDPPVGEGIVERAAREEPDASVEDANPQPGDSGEAGDGEIATERGFPPPAENAAMHLVDVPADLSDLPDPMDEPVGGEPIEPEDLADDEVTMPGEPLPPDPA